MGWTWTDRRPIGIIFLATATPSPSNPNGWIPGFLNANGIIDAGIVNKTVGAQILDAKNKGCQGVIFYNWEGLGWGEANFAGDPFLAPIVNATMGSCMDAAFATLNTVGLWGGCTLRYTTVSRLLTGEYIQQEESSGGSSALCRKMNKGFARWPAFRGGYVDASWSSGDYPLTGGSLEPGIAANPLQQHPNGIILWEWWNNQYAGQAGLPFASLQNATIKKLTDLLPFTPVIYDDTIAMMATIDDAAQSRVAANAAYAAGTAIKAINL